MLSDIEMIFLTVTAIGKGLWYTLILLCLILVGVVFIATFAELLCLLYSYMKRIIKKGN